MKIKVTGRDGNYEEVTGDVGYRLMEVLRELDNGVEAICGGMCSCGTCHVYVDDEWRQRLAAIEPDEDELLDSLENRQENSRLSCQIELTQDLDGISVTIGPEE